ncbi:MAG TPA: 50S ribosomal protein L13 [Anaerolineales bacterium]|nr:50S ribosomal protein L13 [Anaerolineales bacterium]
MEKTYTTKPSDLNQKWHLVDAEGQTLGRLASKIAAILRGKHNPLFVPHLDTGDYVVVINADKIVVHGNKLMDKVYYRHSGYHGGIKSIILRDMMQTHPTRAITFAVRGMLPKNRLGRDMLHKLKVYAGAEHPHAAQQPQPLEL